MYMSDVNVFHKGVENLGYYVGKDSYKHGYCGKLDVNDLRKVLRFSDLSERNMRRGVCQQHPRRKFTNPHSLMRLYETNSQGVDNIAVLRV